MFENKPSVHSIRVHSKLEKNLMDNKFLPSCQSWDCVHWFDGFGVVRKADF